MFLHKKLLKRRAAAECGCLSQQRLVPPLCRRPVPALARQDSKPPPLNPPTSAVPPCVLFQEEEAAATRQLLLAFLTSHAVLWLTPAHALSRDAAGLMRTLRTLQQLKTTLLPCLPSLLGVPAQQASAAQPGLCIPQLLLLAAPGSGAGGQPLQLGQQQQQEWAAAADRQLRSLLKRCGVLQPEDSARALCSLPAGGPLVLALPESLGNGSQTELVGAALAQLTLPAASPGGQPAAKPSPSPAAMVSAVLAAPRAAVAAAAAAGGVQADAQGWRQAVATLAAVLEAAALKAKGGVGGEAHPAVAAAVAVPAEAAAVVAWQEACGDGGRQF